MIKRGKLIVIEGTDGSGKKTQTEILHKRLLNESILCDTISFPRYETPTGKIVGACYLGKPLIEGLPPKSWFPSPTSLDPLVASLYYAADRRYSVPAILKVLESGEHLILDRYVDSNLGHQGGKIRDAKERKVLFNKLAKLEHEILEIPCPDTTIFLYMPWQATKELRKARNEHQDAHEIDDEHLKNAEEAYLQLSELRNWIRIDCVEKGTFSPRSVNDISKEVYDKVKPILEREND